jgi:hypothetical protein
MRSFLIQDEPSYAMDGAGREIKSLNIIFLIFVFEFLIFGLFSYEIIFDQQKTFYSFLQLAAAKLLDSHLQFLSLNRQRRSRLILIFIQRQRI